jgi:hypothetical protein
MEQKNKEYAQGDTYKTNEIFVNKFDKANRDVVSGLFVSGLFDKNLKLGTMRLVERTIKISDLYPSEPLLVKCRVDAIESYDELPIIIEHEGKLVIYDGHHRVASRILRGDNEVLINSYEFCG